MSCWPFNSTAKAFLTETGNESAKHGIQIFGGHGFIVEHGMEQIARDARISTLYEGTTEIQSIDLLARKVLKSKGKLLNNMLDLIDTFIAAHHADPALSLYIEKLIALKGEWLNLTQEITTVAKQNPEEIGAASVDYLYYSGYVVFAYLWAKWHKLPMRNNKTQHRILFYAAKIKTANFFFDKLLTRTQSHAASIKSGASSVMALSEEDFAFKTDDA